MTKEVFILDPKDNVATLVSEEGRAGRVIEIEHQGTKLNVTLRQAIPFAHKFAVERIRRGDQVMKYGHSIGTASRDIEVGDHVHIHNVDSNRGRGDLAAASTSAGKDTHR